MDEQQIRLHYDLQETVVENKFVGLWRMMTGFRVIYLVAVTAAGLAALARTGVYYLLRYFVDGVLLAEGQFGLVPWVALGFIGLALLQGLFTFLTGRLAAQTAEGIVRRLRNYLYDHIQRLSFTYHDRIQTGELLQRATSDVDTLRRLYQEQLIGIGRISLLFMVNVTALLLLDVKLALFSIIVIPVIVAMSLFFFRRMEKVYAAYQSQEATLSSRLQENLTGVRVVKAFARQHYEMERFETENWKKYLRGKELANLHATFWPVTDVLAGIQMLAGFYLAALMAIDGTISVGTYLAYSGLVINIIWPIRGLGRLVAQASTGVVSLGRLQQILRQEREPLDKGVYRPEGRLRGEVRFENVSFAYATPERQGDRETRRQGDRERRRQGDGETRRRGDKETRGESEVGMGDGRSSFVVRPSSSVAPRPSPREWVLRNIDLHVKPGQVIGLLGATGSGKTSLVNLLPRFYDYTQGSITVDGVELRAYSRSYLRSQIGIVQQEPFLFSTTIRNNITYGVGRDVSDEEVEAAARAAAIHEVILDFPQGYDTLVGERGVTLSGGQKQRITIARTLLKDPSLLILDDATSSVDTETDAAIRAALKRLMAGRTTFIIAHRVQSVMEADLILVMEKGRIVQRGTHAELIAQPGLYRRVFTLQAQIEADLEQEVADVIERAEARRETNGAQGVAVGT